jgi:hypothetical protein
MFDEESKLFKLQLRVENLSRALQKDIQRDKSLLVFDLSFTTSEESNNSKRRRLAKDERKSLLDMSMRIRFNRFYCKVITKKLLISEKARDDGNLLLRASLEAFELKHCDIIERHGLQANYY